MKRGAPDDAACTGHCRDGLRRSPSCAPSTRTVPWLPSATPLRSERERLEMEWAQLQLEEATLAHNNRVDKLAREQLGMVEPRDYVIVGARP